MLQVFTNEDVRWQQLASHSMLLFQCGSDQTLISKGEKQSVVVFAQGAIAAKAQAIDILCVLLSLAGEQIMRHCSRIRS